MADYDQIMKALRNAHASGDAAAAKRLAAMAKAAKAGATAPQADQAPTPAAGTPSASPAPAPAASQPYSAIRNEFELGTGELMTAGPGPTGSIDPALYAMGAIGRRMQPGQPAQPTPVADVVTDVGKAGAAGLARGSAMLADLPGTLRDAGMAAAEFVTGRELTPEQRELIRGGALPQLGRGDMRGNLETATGGASEFRGNTVPGQFAGTVAEFAPSAAMFGGAGGANLLRNAALPGIGSEAAGQLTKDTPFEDVARFAGAVIGGVAPDVVNFGTKAFQNAFRMSAQKPTVESLRTVKSIAYKAVDEAGERFQPSELQSMVAAVRTNLDDVNYLPEADTTTAAILKRLDDISTREISLGQLDKMRQTVWARYNSTKEPGLLAVIDGIDELVQSRASTSELLNAARLANSRYKKAELLDDAFTRAADQTAATGSGGNILNKYRQAVTSIINDPKRAKWFSPEEVVVMREFVRGTPGQNVMRLVGKLSPSGNGLMTALNLGAAGSFGPAALIGSAVASGAKAVADNSQGRAAEGLIDMVATGTVPQRAAVGATRNLSIPVAGVGAISNFQR